MTELFLRLKAPFAAFRYFQAGVYRSTMPTIPHSAAWGLINNIMGVETRINVNNIITDISTEIEPLNLAIGIMQLASNNSLYQQLHVVPVGSSGKENADRTKGNKYFIRPVRREMLVNLDVVLAIKTQDASVRQKILNGLNGEYNNSRYGLPFAGDNNFLFDSIEVFEEPKEAAYWYYPLGEDEVPETETVRLTVGINRLDNSETTAPLFAVTKERSLLPPEDSWVWTPRKP